MFPHIEESELGRSKDRTWETAKWKQKTQEKCRHSLGRPTEGALSSWWLNLTESAFPHAFLASNRHY